jgi:hypothetical protein
MTFDSIASSDAYFLGIMTGPHDPSAAIVRAAK